MNDMDEQVYECEQCGAMAVRVTDDDRGERWECAKCGHYYYWRLYGLSGKFTEDDMYKTSLELLARGKNIYPRLMMDESRQLIHLMMRGPQSEEEHETSRRLQKKACGMAGDDGIS